LFSSSLQEWLFFSPAHIAHAFGDAMQVVEATCPRCLAVAQTAMQRQFPALYAPSSEMTSLGQHWETDQIGTQSGKRLDPPSAQRHSMALACPSTQPR
jgi:hypothetical protein